MRDKLIVLNDNRGFVAIDIVVLNGTGEFDTGGVVLNQVSRIQGCPAENAGPDNAPAAWMFPSART